MGLKKINEIVSYYEDPALGTVKANHRFMAITVDKSSKNPYLGLAREITRSKGSVDATGFIDESKLIIVRSDDALKWKKVEDLKIARIEEIIKNLEDKSKDFIGLEDPDIYSDENGLKHIYFTIAFKYRNKIGYEIYLGHARGKSLEKLEATVPCLSPILKKGILGFKEICISNTKNNNPRFNLNEVELYDQKKNLETSAIALTKATKKNQLFEYKRIVLDPGKMKYPWIKGHASPCCFLPSKADKLLIGIINGREPEKIINDEKVYGKFRPGLILFDPKTGEIPWISKKPLFEDPEARTITFASDFLQTKEDEGILYAHVNDAFVRAYKINLKKLREYIKTNF